MLLWTICNVRQAIFRMMMMVMMIVMMVMIKTIKMIKMIKLLKWWYMVSHIQKVDGTTSYGRDIWVWVGCSQMNAMSAIWIDIRWYNIYLICIYINMIYIYTIILQTTKICFEFWSLALRSHCQRRKGSIWINSHVPPSNDGIFRRRSN